MFDPVEKLKQYVRCQSVSTDSSFQKGMTECREFVAGLLTEMGLEVDVIETPLHPVILGKRNGPADWPHVVIYGHYDVQPADPVEMWDTAPFEPVIRDERIYGRGTADNKGPLMVHLAAVASLLEELPDLPLRITFLIEGEEEIGSPSFNEILETRKKDLSADLVFLSDTGSPNESQIVVTCGIRGIVTLDAELTGPKTDLHSGIHGGALLNPIQALMQLCDSLHDTDGRVAIDGFYDDVVDVEDWERQELAKLGVSESEYLDFLGLDQFSCVPGFSPFEAVRFQPTLEFNGIGGGYQGEGSKTVIPSKAFVKISARLVANQTPEKIEALISQALYDRCPAGVSIKVTSGHSGAPYLVVPPGRPNTPEDQSEALAKAFSTIEASVTRVFGKPPLFLREGGSIPIIADIKRVLGMDSIMLGLFLPEDNLHAPNESFHLGVMKKAITVSKDVLKSLALR
ncbi:MAG: M20/M25/M40 family metallo-hydrolase [Opitutaceae bacterium]|nr:M20/M25/M40 family metallo-hydrolase [Opitutaceae bacterium]